jgi:BirA family transcriptional regulator, biotin operon repressor / biotin---[acetyl-CoA-carboxylase] ligase
MDPLDAAAIDLPGVEVRVVARCASTNTILLKQQSASCVLLAAEHQSAGRGRRGRRFHSAPGAGITFSLARRIRRPARELAALSLVAGVAASKALRALGVHETALKWPNDLLVEGAKLGGILVETRTERGLTRAVIGVGVNYRRTPGLEARLRRRIACLEELVPKMPSRNVVIQWIAKALLEALDRFEAQGLEGVRGEWEAMDAHAGQRLRVRLADGRCISGIASGLAPDGALQLKTIRGIRVVASGRVVSARPA